MERTGPHLETLTRRLAETPPDFLDEPRIGSKGQVYVPALVNDLLAAYGTRATFAALKSFEAQDAKTHRNRLALVMLFVWLLADESMVDMRIPHQALLRLLDETAGELAGESSPTNYVNDPERREELVRIVLKRLGLRPAGETEAQATDRLAAISAAERRRLLQASRAAEERARAIREALVRKQAEASADKWTRE